jgi:hypothetical protein
VTYWNYWKPSVRTEINWSILEFPHQLQHHLATDPQKPAEIQFTFQHKTVLPIHTRVTLVTLQIAKEAPALNWRNIPIYCELNWYSLIAAAILDCVKAQLHRQLKSTFVYQNGCPFWRTARLASPLGRRQPLFLHTTDRLEPPICCHAHHGTLCCKVTCNTPRDYTPQHLVYSSWSSR